MKYSKKMPNEGKGQGAGSAKNGSSHGASTGLKMENSMRADVTKMPTTKNPYPHGLA